MFLNEKLNNTKESRTHLSAKIRAAILLERHPHYIIVNVPEGTRNAVYKMETNGCDIVLECGYPSSLPVVDKNLYVAEHGRLPSIIFDIGLVKDGVVVAAIEVSCSHWLDQKKIKKIAKSNVIVLEVEAFHAQWSIENHNRLECENLILPIKPLVEFRRMRPGDIL